ncbi:hypothetical protein AAFF_G00344240 [Aldrovandia affinis]|uniref:Uncharacterized protein n=1 Tax=Aldrovandia affinis TaxID=143900 RepID=A0AAD7SK22_9TELE|nr:hypothetical protein AAFF_G00344240 [Aldrovandia affinis]
MCGGGVSEHAFTERLCSAVNRHQTFTLDAQGLSIVSAQRALQARPQTCLAQDGVTTASRVGTLQDAHRCLHTPEKRPACPNHSGPASSSNAGNVTMLGILVAVVGTWKYTPCRKEQHAHPLPLERIRTAGKNSFPSPQV